MSEENTILFLGDVFPYKPFKFTNNLKAVVNLDCPITSESEPISGKVNLSVKKNHLKSIFKSDLLAVSLGNNNIMDYGLDGLKSTINELEKEGISYFGVNNPDNDDHNPLIIEFNKMKIAFFSVISESTVPLVEFEDFNYLTLLDTDEMASKIGAVRDSVKRIVIYIHWGEEESSYPSQGDILTARKLIDSGADIIIGSHAHAPQPVEKYRNGVIAYNLGNFIMPAFKNTPSYFDEVGTALSVFSKKLMLWNRISWGVAINMDTMETIISKHVFIADRILALRTTPLDKYLGLHPHALTESYEAIVKKHLKKRAFRRKIKNFLNILQLPAKKYRNV